MPLKLLQDKEGQTRTKMNNLKSEILRLKNDEDHLKTSIMLLTRRLYSVQDQAQELQTEWQTLDRQLAFLDGRYQVLNPKKSITRTRKAKPDPDLTSMTSDQLSFLKSALEQLMKESKDETV